MAERAAIKPPFPLPFEFCFAGMSNPPYGGVELPFLKGGRVNSPPFLKGDLEGFLYEVMRDTKIGQLHF